MEARKLYQSFALRSPNQKVWYYGQPSATLALKTLNPNSWQSFNQKYNPLCIEIRSLAQKFHPFQIISVYEELLTMTFQRCAIVVGILVCYSLSSLEAAINCERLVFHPDCRGSQTKRSSFQTDETTYLNVQALEDLFGMPDNSRKSSHPSRSRNSINNNYEKSRLWTALLDRGLNPEAMYDWYLAHLEEKSADANRQNWIQDNFPGKNVVDGDY